MSVVSTTALPSGSNQQALSDGEGSDSSSVFDGNSLAVGAVLGAFGVLVLWFLYRAIRTGLAQKASVYGGLDTNTIDIAARRTELAQANTASSGIFQSRIENVSTSAADP